MKWKQRILAFALAVLNLVTICSISVPPARAAEIIDINDDRVFLKQDDKYTCTLVSALMMFRRAALLNRNPNWDSFTEEEYKPKWWNSGLKGTFRGEDMVAYGGQDDVNPNRKKILQYSLGDLNGKKEALINLLNKHKEGIVCYLHEDRKAAHAVLMTDYDSATDTFYCADPSKYGVDNREGTCPSGRIPVYQSRLALTIRQCGYAPNYMSDKEIEDCIISHIRGIWVIKSGINYCRHNQDYYETGYCKLCKTWMPTTPLKVDTSHYYKVCNNKTAYVRSMPYLESKNLPDETVKPIRGGTREIKVLYAVTNGFGEGHNWYYIQWAKGNLEGFVYEGNLEIDQETIPAEIKADSLRIPNGQFKNGGQGFYIDTKLTASNCNISKISSRMLSDTTGKPVQTVKKYALPAGTTVYETKRKEVDNGIHFALLVPDRYHYEIAVESTEPLVKHDPGDPKKITFRSGSFEVISGVHQHNFNIHEFEERHPHKGYDKCSCGTTRYTGDNTYMVECPYCTGVTVSFDPAGGYVHPASKNVTPGQSFGVLPIPEREHHIFEGWYQGNTLCSADTVCTSLQDLTLQAHWRMQCTVTLDAAGGSCSVQTFYKIPGDPLGELPSPVRKGHIFEGWYTAPENGTLCTKDTLCTEAESMNLYAHWTPAYEISYHSAIPATEMPEDQLMRPGQSIFLDSSIPAAENFNFKYWTETPENIGTQYHPGDRYDRNADLSLYAQWELYKTGSFADNPDLTWTLRGRTLSITGTGAVPHFAPDHNTPWDLHADYISAIEIGSGVTSLGENAFAGLSELKFVDLGADVTFIGKDAFKDCPLLEGIKFDGNTRAWRKLYVESGNESFIKCDALFRSPATLVASGSCGQFLMWELDTNYHLSIIGSGVMNSYSDRDALWAPYPVKSVSLSDPLTKLGSGAFRGLPITEITIPDGVHQLPPYLFSGCTHLNRVTLPTSILSIESHAFDGCPSNLNIYYHGTQAQWDAITICPYNNEAILNKKVLLPPMNGSCGNQVTWELTPYGALKISGTGTMTDYALPQDAPWYEKREFINSISISSGITALGSNAFCGISVSRIALPETVTEIGTGTFDACASLNTVTLPAGITQIGAAAFRGCTALRSCQYHGSETSWAQVTVGAENEPLKNAELLIYRGPCGDGLTWSLDSEGVMTINGIGPMYDFGQFRAPWYYCSDQIRKIEFGDQVTSIGSYAFYEACALTEVVIPANIRYIGASAFEGAFATDTSVVVPPSVTTIGSLAFASSGLKRAAILAQDDNFYDILYNCINLSDVIITSPLLGIYKDMFFNCGRLRQIYLPQSITKIDLSTCSNRIELYYAGTQMQWDQIAKNTNAYVIPHCNSDAPCVLGHFWDSGIVTSEPGCETEGQIEYTCLVCGETRTEILEMLGHKPISAQNGKSTTCTEPGKEPDIICEVCGQVLEQGNEIPARGHVGAYYPLFNGTHQCRCIRCGEVYGLEACDDRGIGGRCSCCNSFPVIPSECRHFCMVQVDEYPATCTKEGMKAHGFCLLCHTCFNQNKIPVNEDSLRLPVDPNNHRHIETLPAKQATCTEPGYTESKICLDCGKILKQAEPLPCTGHEMVQHEGKAPTCTEAGWAPYETCSRCNVSTYEELPPLGHNSDGNYQIENMIEPGIDHDGSCDHVYYCTHCGAELERIKTIIPAYTFDAPILCNGQGYSTLTDAFKAAQDGDTIQLTRNFQIGFGDSDAQPGPVYIDENRNLTLDLGGNTLFHGIYGTRVTGINLKGGSLTVKHGTIMTIDRYYGIGICVENANLVLEPDASIIGGWKGVYLLGNAHLENHGSVRIAGDADAVEVVSVTGQGNTVDLYTECAISGGVSDSAAENPEPLSLMAATSPDAQRRQALNLTQAESVRIHGGFVEGEIATTSKTLITGGMFTVDVSQFLAPGYQCIPDGIYYTVQKEVIPTTGITLDQRSVHLVEGKTTELYLTVQPADATDRSVIWTSSDPSVARVDYGCVTALREGTATISVQTADGNHSAQCHVTVAPNPDLNSLQFTVKSHTGSSVRNFSIKLRGKHITGYVLIALYNENDKMASVKCIPALENVAAELDTSDATYARVFWINQNYIPVCGSQIQNL